MATLLVTLDLVDGAGLALFAVSGADKALEFGLGPVAAARVASLVHRARS